MVAASAYFTRFPESVDPATFPATRRYREGPAPMSSQAQGGEEVDFVYVTLGTVTRPEDKIQVTYKGLPLYTFTADKKRGQVKGDGLKDVGTWHPASVSGRTGSATTPSGPGAY